MKFRYKENRTAKTCAPSDLVEELIKKFNLTADFSIESLKNEWNQIVGEILSTHTKPVKIENEILYIYSDHPVFSNDVSMLKSVIKEKLMNSFGIKIKDMRIIKR